MNMNYGITKNFVDDLRKFTQYQFDIYNIEPSFPKDIANLKESDFKVEKCSYRKEFLEEKVLTIDAMDCKDMDDAVSLMKTSLGYRLAVHVADVASYVPLGSKLDRLASYRATSIYLPHLTVPMLPNVLFNNCCSLKAGVLRNTLSVIMYINKKGDLVSSKIIKGLIKSKVKGVYSEVNKLLSGVKDEVLIKKYKDVYKDIFEMSRLYQILRSKRIARGSNTEDANKPKIVVSNNDIVLIPKKEGIAENMIEEFMILANNVVAEYLYNNNLPAIYRTHEKKKHLALYNPIKLHHEDLALESYSHFTSPIRRISDLKIHQVLTMHLNGYGKKKIDELFTGVLDEICYMATKRIRTVKQVVDKCEKYCYKQYFLINWKNKYTGKVVAFDYLRRPIIEISKYNIKILGDDIRVGKINEWYSFNVDVSKDSNKLLTINSRRIRF